MKPTRIAAILLLAFLFGGSSAEVAVQTKRAIDRHRAAREEGSAGELVALEIQREGGEIVARPRVIAAPGKPAQILLRDPGDGGVLRLALRLETVREPSGDVSIDYELEIPGEDLVAAGRVTATPGVEHAFALGGGRALSATVFTLPVPSAAFEAYLQAAEREARAVPLSRT